MCHWKKTSVLRGRGDEGDFKTLKWKRLHTLQHFSAGNRVQLCLVNSEKTTPPPHLERVQNLMNIPSCDHTSTCEVPAICEREDEVPSIKNIYGHVNLLLQTHTPPQVKQNITQQSVVGSMTSTSTLPLE